jgi:hypothetical protein
VPAQQSPPPTRDGANLFRPRRRPLLRLILALFASAIALATTAIAIWLRLTIVPPNCSDPSTLALVHRSLTNRFKLPPGVTIDNIHTLAGGYLGFRFSCKATLDNIDRNALPPGTAIPGFVYYISQLTPDHQRHEVTVRIEPLLIMEKVE